MKFCCRTTLELVTLSQAIHFAHWGTVQTQRFLGRDSWAEGKKSATRFFNICFLSLTRYKPVGNIGVRDGMIFDQDSLL